MNILIIDHYAGSTQHGMEYRPFYFAREWVRLGHQVTIVAATWSHLRMQNPDVKANIAEETIQGIRYIWLKTPRYTGNGIGRVRNILTFVGRLLSRHGGLVRRRRPDVVIASSTYPLDIVPAYRIARKSNAKLIYEVHDLWPLTPIELGGLSPRNPFILLMQWAENFAYRKADRVASMLPCAKSHMQAHGMADHKFAYIPNGIHVEEWENSAEPLPTEHQETVAALAREGRFLVGYAGAHGIPNALHTLLDAAKLLQSQPIAFVLVGQGSEKKALQQQAQRLGLTNVLFLPPIAKAAVPALLASMDVLVICWQRTPLYRFGVSPNKLLDYMMAGKPVIHAIEAGNDLVAESCCGITIPPEDPEAIAEAILQMMHLPAEEREAMGQRGKAYVLANSDYRVLARQFLEIMA